MQVLNKIDFEVPKNFFYVLPYDNTPFSREDRKYFLTYINRFYNFSDLQTVLNIDVNGFNCKSQIIGLSFENEVVFFDISALQNMRLLEDIAFLRINNTCFIVPFDSNTYLAIACLRYKLKLKELRKGFFANPNHIYDFYTRQY